LFLSCSADWSLNLYHLHSKSPLLSFRASGECASVSDVSWCPGNSTVFACVTMDAKLQIWDLSVSALDPVVTIDVGAEDERERERERQREEEKDRDSHDRHDDHLPATSTPALGASRYVDRNEIKEELQYPVARLLKNLAMPPKRRTLTTVLFGEKNPIVAVGDSKGCVSIFRVFDPVTINHLGPLQQFNKLKDEIVRQTDPQHVTMIASDSLLQEDMN
jgi:WD40 repeat protein